MHRMSLCAISLVLPLLAVVTVGCNKEEAPPPPPASAAPSAESVPTLEMEPLPDPVVDAGPEVKKGTGGGRSAGSLQACCDALMQNAAAAPEPTATYMKQAAATCGSLAAQGKDKASIIGILQAALRGAGMPAACR